MKIRTDFVTNSSSSSFILAYNSREEAIEAVTKELENNPEALEWVLRDINRVDPLSEEELDERLRFESENRADSVINYGEDSSWWSSEKDTWANRWRNTHPNAGYYDMYESPEYLAEKERLSKEFFAEMKFNIAGKSFVIELEYEDDDKLGAELECEIMPQIADETFNHH